MSVTVTKFSKATGDYAALSKTDILVMALAHQLHLEHASTVPLRTEPLTNEQVVTFDREKSVDNKVFGFVYGDNKDDEEEDEEDESDDDEGWVDSSNYKNEPTCEESTIVGCYTTDFAMQVCIFYFMNYNIL